MKYHLCSSRLYHKPHKAYLRFCFASLVFFVSLATSACGNSPNPRLLDQDASLSIIGPKSVVSYHPTTVLLREKNKAFCVGGYVAPSTIVTAGHCVNSLRPNLNNILFPLKHEAGFVHVPIVHKHLIMETEVGVMLFDEAILEEKLAALNIPKPEPAPIYPTEVQDVITVNLQGYAGSVPVHSKTYLHIRSGVFQYFPAKQIQELLNQERLKSYVPHLGSILEKASTFFDHLKKQRPRPGDITLQELKRSAFLLPKEPESKKPTELPSLWACTGDSGAPIYKTTSDNKTYIVAILSIMQRTKYSLKFPGPYKAMTTKCDPFIIVRPLFFYQQTIMRIKASFKFKKSIAANKQP